MRPRGAAHDRPQVLSGLGHPGHAEKLRRMPASVPTRRRYGFVAFISGKAEKVSNQVASFGYFPRQPKSPNLKSR